MEEHIKRTGNHFLKTRGKILVISHYDADGIASSALIQKTLSLLKRSFDSTFVKILDKDFLESVKNKSYKVVVFSDIGSGSVEEIESVLKDKYVYIIDHHSIQKMPSSPNIFLINPILFGFESWEVSGSGMSFLFSKSLSPRIKEYSYLSVVGAFADSQIEENIGYINKMLLDEALLTNKLEKRKGLKIFGRFSRPLYKALEYTYEPYIDGISGCSSGAIQFLNSLGIDYKRNGKYRVYDDLSDIEKEKLLVSLLLEIKKEDVSRLVGDVFKVLGKYEVREFVTLLNACGRMEFPQEGVKLCLGLNNNAERIYDNYREELSKTMSELRKKGYIKKGKFKIYELKGRLSSNFTGTILSMLIKKEDSETILISISEEGNWIKISSRTKNKSVDLSRIMSEVCVGLGGYGGGHKSAAGGKIPIDKKNMFFKTLEDTPIF